MKSKKEGLFYAIYTNNIEEVNRLINIEVDVNVKGSGGETALMWAVWIGNKEIAQALIDAGVDVNAKGGGGETALMWAAAKGNKEIAQVLIDAGVDVNAGDYDRRTAMMLAIWNGSDETIKVLNDNGADTPQGYVFSRDTVWLLNILESKKEPLLLLADIAKNSVGYEGLMLTALENNSNIKKQNGIYRIKNSETEDEID